VADGVQGDPGGAHHGVPDQTLVPHLHDETQVQAVDLTGGDAEQKKNYFHVPLR